jgi:hypothetical protein
MIPASIGALLVVLTFPFLIVAVVVYPMYLVQRYRVGGALLYAVLVIAILAPDVEPSVSRFVHAGGLAMIVPIIFIDVMLGAVLSPERARRANARRGVRAKVPRAAVR